MNTRRRFRSQLFLAFALGGAFALAPAAASAQGKPAAGKPVDHKAATAKPAGKPPVAKPGDAKDDPKAKYHAALKKLDGGDYAGALADFRDLDALKSTPQSRHYIAVCLDKLGKYADAVAAYDKFLANSGKLTKEADLAKKRIEEIKKMPAKLHVDTTPPGAAILVDGKASGASPADLDVSPGKHLVHVELAGYSGLDKDVDAAYGGKLEVSATLVKSAEPPVIAANPPPVSTQPGPTTAPPPPAKPKSKLPAIITGGLAVLAVGFGTGFGVAALMNKSDYDKNPSSGLADAGENNALVADMLFGVAITLGVTSAVLFFTKDEATDKPKATLAPVAPRDAKIQITPVPIVTRNGGGVGAMVRF